MTARAIHTLAIHTFASQAINKQNRASVWKHPPSWTSPSLQKLVGRLQVRCRGAKQSLNRRTKGPAGRDLFRSNIGKWAANAWRPSC